MEIDYCRVMAVYCKLKAVFPFFFAEMDLHKQRLASVCSICVAKDVLENPRFIHAVNFSEAIIMISPGVNVLLDSPNVHPPYMCYCCCYYFNI